jgi:hypothetical protein
MTMPLAAGPLVVAAGLPALSIVALAALAPPIALALRLREPSPGSYAHEPPARPAVA